MPSAYCASSQRPETCQQKHFRIWGSFTGQQPVSGSSATSNEVYLVHIVWPFIGRLRSITKNRNLRTGYVSRLEPKRGTIRNTQLSGSMTLLISHDRWHRDQRTRLKSVAYFMKIERFWSKHERLGRITLDISTKRNPKYECFLPSIPHSCTSYDVSYG
jgi:hypothetical protein